MKKAVYIDTFSTQHLHEMYNASSLKMFASMYDVVEYRTSRSSEKHVRALMGGNLPQNVVVKELNTINSIGDCSALRRFIKQLQAVCSNTQAILFAKNGTDVIINYNTALALPFINWAAKRNKDVRVLQVCHGEMQDLLRERPTSTLFKWGLSLFTKDSVLIAPNLWFAVLGQSIRKNLYGLITPQCFEKMLTFDHTAIFDKIQKKEHKDNEKLVLGFIGALRNSKGLDDFFKLANTFKNDPRVELRVIGYLSGLKEKLLSVGIVIPEGVGDRFLTRQEMYDHISQLDYALYLFPRQGYRFTASGSVFDAIDCGRPIISLTNDYFEGMFDVCGRFGFLEEDLNALTKRIEWLADHKTEMIWDINKVKTQLQPESVAKRFYKQWNL